jgi:hypothetical protein
MARWLKPLTSDPVRTAVRFPIRMPLTVLSNGVSFLAETENISASGLLFCCRAKLAVGAKLEFTMSMPGSVMGSKCDLVVHCKGRVVRTYEQGANQFVGAGIDEYSLKA